MVSTSNRLKNINPLLVWRTENEINDFVLFLEKNGFLWVESKKAFYNSDLDFTIYPKDVEEFIDNYDALKEEIKKRERIDKKEECFGNFRVAGYVINILTFFTIMNLFLGWILLHFALWIIIELLLIFLLISFVRIRKKIKVANK